MWVPSPSRDELTLGPLGASPGAHHAESSPLAVWNFQHRGVGFWHRKLYPKEACEAVLGCPCPLGARARRVAAQPCIRVIPSALLGRKRIRRPGLGWAGEDEASAASGRQPRGSLAEPSQWLCEPFLLLRWMGKLRLRGCKPVWSRI